MLNKSLASGQEISTEADIEHMVQTLAGMTFSGSNFSN